MNDLKVFNLIVNTIPLSKDFSISQVGEVFNVELSLNIEEISDVLDNAKLPIGTKRFGNEILLNGNKIKFTTLNKTQKFRVERERPNSSNVRFLRYYTETSKLQVGFWSRAVYEYDGVDTERWDNIRSGNSVCKTTGSNDFGSWFIGKSPSWGAAIHEYLINSGISYRKL